MLLLNAHSLNQFNDSFAYKCTEGFTLCYFCRSVHQKRSVVIYSNKKINGKFNNLEEDCMEKHEI